MFQGISTITTFILLFIFCAIYSQTNHSTSYSKDSTHIQQLRIGIKEAYNKVEWGKFKDLQKEQIKLTLSVADTTEYARVLRYYEAYYTNIDVKSDSAYYYNTKIFNIYHFNGDSIRAGRRLLNKAILQKNFADYAGSGTTSFKALEYLKSSNDNRRISSIYNNLGIVYDRLKDIDNSIKYHQKSLEIRSKADGKILYILHSLNNIGIAYSKNGDYNKAINHFNKAFQYDSILNTHKELKAKLIDNNAFAHYKNTNANVLSSLLEALEIREDIQHDNGIIISSIHLAEFYHDTGNAGRAIFYAKQAEELSLKTENYRDLLESLHILGNYYNTSEAKRYFNKFIAIKDSLDYVSRKHRDQFAKIEFEVSEKEELILDQQKEIKRKSYINIGTISLIIIILGLIFGIAIKKLLKKRGTLINFDEFLSEKYHLHNENLELWKFLVEGLTQEEIAEKIFRSVDTVKTRRRALYKKIRSVQTNLEKLDKSKAIIIYKEEQELHKTALQKNLK